MLKYLVTETFMTLKLKRLGRIAAIFGREAADLGQPGNLPRIIHMFWDQGFDNAPPLIQLCVASWQDQNPTWRLNMLDASKAEKILARSTLPAGSSIQAYADVLRVRLLRERGGIWVDATCYCNKPLDEWLFWVLAQSDFFAFARPAYDRPLANWFLASQRKGRIITRFDNDISNYVRHLRKPPRAYVWPHYLFEANLLLSRSLRRSWSNVPSLSSVPIHLAQTILIEGREPTLEELHVLSAVPLHKLTYKKGVTDDAVLVLLSNIASYTKGTLSLTSQDLPGKAIAYGSCRR